MKRHPSLAALSRHHHLALLLAQRIRQGKSRAAKAGWPEDRDSQRRRSLEFFDTELVIHLEAEEKFLFPLAEAHLPPELQILPLLRKQHTQIRGLAEQLRKASGGQLENLLLRFAHVLEDHIRKEERIFFERLQRDVPEEKLAECGEQVEAYLEGHRLKTEPPR